MDGRTIPDPERRAAARAQLIQLLAERLVREAQATLTIPETPDARSPLRPIQHRQAARELD